MLLHKFSSILTRFQFANFTISIKFSATLIFGGIVCAAGFVGVILGSSAAQYFRKYDGRADPFVCAVGIFVACPLTFFGLALARSATSASWVLLFLSVTALSTNWAVVSDMLLTVTLPNKRAFATSIQILVSHLFGDATSPFITGFIRDGLDSMIKEPFEAFMYALLSTLIILAVGGLLFLRSAKYYVQDVENCKKQLGVIEDANLTDFATLS